MIVIYHNNNIVNLIFNRNKEEEIEIKCKNLTSVLLEICGIYPQNNIVWCNEILKDNLNFKELEVSQLQPMIVQSYNTKEENFFLDEIGYVNESLHIRVNKQVKYGTWQMSSDVGCINAAIINVLKNDIIFDLNFDYFINSLAKLAMPLGLFCYSNPNLLLSIKCTNAKPAHLKLLFRFVSQHQKKIWVFLLFFNLMVYEKRFAFFELIFALFHKRRILKNIALFQNLRPEIKRNPNFGTLDVLIPTLGRKIFLYDFLKDLNKQTLLPNRVIIIEQNPKETSVSDLHYLTEEKWNFEIKHFFTHQSGACNARNIALNNVKSDWVFFADDDIRIETTFIATVLAKIGAYSAEVATINCGVLNQKEVFKNIVQWETFGSGCSFAKKDALTKCKFDMALEFGYGEDSDFGRQIRNNGFDILYLPKPKILHLKAPIGGFRTKQIHPWRDDNIQPKPAPTVMLSILKNQTKQQVLGYKTILFIKYYKHQNLKNPLKYYYHFKKQWKQSLFWAQKLANKNA